ncbi:MAG: hypothetical protein MZV63_17040, partial [Marinilabiliales bacterium]|nr:hypothetical protein [Marinilabiliales bacterium]
SYVLLRLTWCLDTRLQHLELEPVKIEPGVWKPEVKEAPVIAEVAAPKPAEPEKPVEQEIPAEPVVVAEEEPTETGIKVLGKIDLDSLNQKTRPAKKTKEEKKAGAAQKVEEKKAKKVEEDVPEVKEEVIEEPVAEPEVIAPEPVKEETPEVKGLVRDANFIPTRIEKLDGPKIFGKIELPVEKKAGEETCRFIYR